VAGRDGEKVVLVGKTGSLWLGPTVPGWRGKFPWSICLIPPGPRTNWHAWPAFPRRDLLRAWAWNDQRVISFEEQARSHGGSGRVPEQPVHCLPCQAPLSTEEIRGEEVYGRFAGAYGV